MFFQQPNTSLSRQLSVICLSTDMNAFSGLIPKSIDNSIIWIKFHIWKMENIVTYVISHRIIVTKVPEYLFNKFDFPGSLNNVILRSNNVHRTQLIKKSFTSKCIHIQVCEKIKFFIRKITF